MSAILSVTTNSKDLAVEELRCNIEQNNQLREQVAKSNEESSNALAELSEVRKELENTRYDMEVVNRWLEWQRLVELN